MGQICCTNNLNAINNSEQQEEITHNNVIAYNQELKESIISNHSGQQRWPDTDQSSITVFDAAQLSGLTSLRLSFITPIKKHSKNYNTLESTATIAAMNSFADSEDGFSFKYENSIDALDEDESPEIPDEDNSISFPMFLTNDESQKRVKQQYSEF